MINRIDVDGLNLMASNNIDQFVRFAEKSYQDQLVRIGDSIQKEIKTKRFILITGPSASGKTFTARLLRRHLQSRGIDSILVSLDNFYKDRQDLPYEEDGTQDYETTDAFDVQMLHQCLQELAFKGRTYLPHFNFKEGMRDRTDRTLLKDGQVVIIEGLHALNPLMIPTQLIERCHRYYIAVQTSFDVQGKQVLSYKDVRLLRRLIRDYRHRGIPFKDTLDIWDHVVSSERKYIIPFTSSADKVIDSIHLYEPMVYHSIFPTHFLGEQEQRHREKLSSLQEGLSHFASIDRNYVPDTSLLVEFLF